MSKAYKLIYYKIRSQKYLNLTLIKNGAVNGTKDLLKKLVY